MGPRKLGPFYFAEILLILMIFSKLNKIELTSLAFYPYKMTMQIDVNQTILIVVGMDLEPEEADRPLAYKLKAAIESSKYFGAHPFRKCIVISDALYQNDKLIKVCPTIAIGGPGVNSLAGELVEKLPVYLSKGNKYFIQLDKEFKDFKVSIWGMDRESTSLAVDLFIANGIMESFLKAIWK
jgi:hypothetical protein